MTSTMKDKDRQSQCHTDAESIAATNKGAALSRVALEDVAGKTNGEAEAVDRFMFTDDDAQPVGKMDKDKARQRLNHNNIERKRKDRIKSGIQSIREILPPPKNFEQKESANAVLERAAETIQELRVQNDRLLVQGGDKLQAEEIEKLRNEIQVLKNENERYQELLMQAGIPHTIDPSSVCLSWTRSKGSVKLSTKKATAGSVTDHDKPLHDVSTVVPKKQSNQLNELENSHAAAPCQVGFDTMSNFAANAALFAPSGTPVSSMFAPANIFAGMPPELTARAMTSNANWLMLPSNANSIVPTSNVVMGGQESEEHKVADTGASNACINKVLSCDAGGLASCQTGAVTIGNSGDATTVTQSLNLKTPIMATNQGGTNIATAQQQHVINLSDPMANQNAGIPVLQNPALMAGAMAGPQLRGNLLMHNGQLILINDQPVMPAVQTVIKNETADKPGQCMSTAGVSSATGAVQSPSSVLSSLQCTPTSTPVPSNTVTSVASTPLFTQAVTTSNTLLPRSRWR
ncbi:Basic helix-loop-helix domain-containing protein USF3 [Lamellibrachia satsuma]|nr:Basic helix-loop-helix domain-containing protein USF3 [Lamellibrachia satsuma]